MLSLRNISKAFPDFSLQEITFSLHEGDYFILLGESGAGKSLILETIAGLIFPDSGNILLDGMDITRERIQNRHIGLVFQDHAVFPHLTVFNNLAYPLHGKRLSPAERKKTIMELAVNLEIEGLLSRYPATLSGGELQRVALGRSLIQKPRVLLLDEPLASVDSRLKTDLRRLLRKIHGQGQTILHVTHDYEEAIALSTRIAVVDKGTILQTGSPDEIFHHPKNEFIASFTGIRNFFPARLQTTNSTTFAVINDQIAVRVLHELETGEVFVLIRGEDVLISSVMVDTSATNSFFGTVREVIPARVGLDIMIDIGIEIHAWITHDSAKKFELKTGSKCWIHFKATAVRLIKR